MFFLFSCEMAFHILSLHRENPSHPKRKKCKRNTQRLGFLREESLTKENAVFSCNISWWKSYSIISRWMKLFQQIFNYRLSSIFWFVSPSEPKETRFLSVFEHVLSRVSNVMNFMNCPFGKLWIAKQKNTLLRRITWNLAVFFRLVIICIYTYWIAVLHCPASLRLKSK